MKNLAPRNQEPKTPILCPTPNLDQPDKPKVLEKVTKSDCALRVLMFGPNVSAGDLGKCQLDQTYRQLMVKIHPDKNPKEDPEQSNKAVLRVQQAKDFLEALCNNSDALEEDAPDDSEQEERLAQFQKLDEFISEDPLARGRKEPSSRRCSAQIFFRNRIY